MEIDNTEVELTEEEVARKAIWLQNPVTGEKLVVNLSDHATVGQTVTLPGLVERWES